MTVTGIENETACLALPHLLTFTRWRDHLLLTTCRDSALFTYLLIERWHVAIADYVSDYICRLFYSAIFRRFRQDHSDTMPVF